MTRAFVIVLDSVGIGGAPDADRFFNGSTPDTGANTLGHIAQACAAGRAETGRSGPLRLPVLDGLGLGRAVALASGLEAPGLGAEPTGAWGAATEHSAGKDTPTGHWELAGVPVPWDWHVFPKADPCFPPEITRALCEAAGTEGILGNRYASGTLIIEEEAAAHMRSGWPICYTSVDSVLQIAAHEERFGLERLYAMCRAVAPMLHEMKVGRVIARPFVGDEASGFTRTQNRKDFAIEPPAPTLLDAVQGAGRQVHAVGKIGDIFSMRGVDTLAKGDDAALMDALDRLAGEAGEGDLVFANLVEFDSLWGHRRDPSGYARALEWVDGRIGALIGRLREGDLLLITADHGNDPTFAGTDHTRERVPVLAHGLGVRELGICDFVDVAATVTDFLGVPAAGQGHSLI
ncbi:phosphopentomutase [Pseudoroseicyclus aestuarii]|uniref:Phosphopentomutase n=1 Tax=Pseudoroseicyclus aestuarii TaxID=1795041 RepID=A0A318SYW7_9RHOB|nr:phosphopentomutase [Pseudoroseicyclus aestuarii]PYE85619.1 phosphopentomutase [Pseudoroseicyclus aestuarii]